MPFVAYLSNYRRRAKRYFYHWAPGDRAAATIHRLPVLPRLIPIPRTEIDDMPQLDHLELATLLKNQAILCKDKYFGAKIQMTFRALELLVGEEEANRQVFEIIQDYLNEKQAA